ncbi:MAG: amino acid ABC transporter permease [Eubacteriaceae bacterium]|jgi:polar amino acid transport system permease protein|nr:amino acid ABC transporter permease [Eubacteriaceae bacterium]
MDFSQMMRPMLQGTWISLEIFFLTILLAMPLGLFVAFGRMSKIKIISVPIRFYQLLMRGTPLILQLMFVFFVPYYIFGTPFKSRFTAAIVAFVLNYAAYFAEIYRGGIESIDQGQYEAAKVLGYSKAQTYLRIIIPQVVKRILPPMGNEFMTLVKDTALAQTIGVVELYRNATNITSRTSSITPLIVAGIIYFVLNFVVEKFFLRAEKKLDYYQ